MAVCSWSMATVAGRRLLQKGRARRVERLRGGIAHLGEDDQQVLARAAELMEGPAGLRNPRVLVTFDALAP